ncbi:MAG: hypothetical protein JEZ09_06200 [Salinivirgaceae bacterium]|nr:hypothetical protein [Salinivirgaceae bacterium]
MKRNRYCKVTVNQLCRYGLLVLIAVGLFACASILPAAKDNFKEAKDLFDLGKRLEAIEKITAAIVIQPDYQNAQKFIYKNWDISLPSAVSEAKRLSNSTKIDDAERVVSIYKSLINIYTNLAKVKLPFAHPKGKWTWDTKIIDYTADYNAAITYAHKLFYEQAKEKVDVSELKLSYDLFSRMYDKYTFVENKDSVAQQVANIYNAFGVKYEMSNSIDEVINAYDAYGYSLKFVSNKPKILEARENAAARISDLYLANAKELFAANDIKTLMESLENCKKALQWNKGNSDATEFAIKVGAKIHTVYFTQAQAEEQKNTIQSLEESLKLYKLALEWKKDDQITLDKIATVEEKLAEKYYRIGKNLEKSKGSKDEIIKNYKLAQKWVPNYRDTQKRIHIVTIIDEIKKLENNIAATKKQNEISRANATSTGVMLGKAETGLNKITYVSGKFKDLHGSMKTIITTCSALAGIPVVGTIATAAKTTITVAKQPIDEVVHTFNTIEKPIVLPSKKVVSKSKGLVDSVNVKMASVSKSLALAKTSAQVFRECIQNMEKVEDLKSIENEIVVVNKNLDKFNNEFKNVNNSLEGIKKVATSFYGYVSPINEVERGINSMSGAINSIKSATDGINSVLNKRIPVPFKDDPSIRDILGATTGWLSALMDEATKPLKPYLNQLAKQIPPIPGIDEFTANVSKLKVEYEKINSEYDKAKASYNKLTNYEKQMKDSFNKIIDRTGCGTKI